MLDLFFFSDLFIHLIITMSDRIKTSNNENNKLIFLSSPFPRIVIRTHLVYNHISRRKLII